MQHDLKGRHDAGIGRILELMSRDHDHSKINRERDQDEDYGNQNGEHGHDHTFAVFGPSV